MNSDHLADVRHLRALAGNPVDRIADMQSGIRRLDSIVTNWRTFGARPRSLQDAEIIVEGLRRALVELRTQGEGADAG
ncbi:hypothetical protein [Dokdonella immobilis]|uniref:Uncharacterized protein n=1 Tax=Dokdonella immobilis TaxID=578942 RepID=A0A1I4VV15_9GAMM|nr:hypothetical protein [Dokdonella immobilis]SFN05020.1 hypothetical protein SAMN05216289_10376 [Dokdonella immobilis]